MINIGRSYLYCAIDKSVKNKENPEKLIGLVKLAAKYLNCGKKIKSSKIIDDQIVICNNFLLVLKNKLNTANN